MKITEIIVSAGRTFNHPYENYSNLRPNVTFKASLGEDENPETVTKELQAKAESMVEDHKQHLLDSLHKLEMLREYEQKVVSLEKRIKTAQEELEDIRAQKGKFIEAPKEEQNEFGFTEEKS